MDHLIRESRSLMHWYGRNIPVILMVLLAVDCFCLHFKQVYSLIVYLPAFAVIIAVGYKKKKMIEAQLEKVCADFDQRFGRSEAGESQGESHDPSVEDHASASSFRSSSDPAFAASDNRDQAILSPDEAKKHLDEMCRQTRQLCSGFGQNIPIFLLVIVALECLRGHLDDASLAGAFTAVFIMSFFISRNLTRIQNQVLQDFSRLESESLSRL